MLHEKATLGAWQQDEEYFFSTKACEMVKNIIKAQNLVIVTGPSGSGKSAIIHHIALKYKNQGWTVKPVDGVDGFKSAYTSRNSESKTFFVIDDPFGKESFDKVKYGSWVEIECFIKSKDETSGNENRSNGSGDKKISSKQNLKIIMSNRNFEHHVSTAQGMFNDKSSIIDINGAQCKLADHEKRAILLKYTPDLNLSEEEYADIIKNDTYFP